MTYSEWLKTNDPIDRLVAAAPPPLSELEELTVDAILGGYKGTVAQNGMSLGIDPTDAEVEEIVFRLVSVKECPPFCREDYDPYCWAVHFGRRACVR